MKQTKVKAVQLVGNVGFTVARILDQARDRRERASRYVFQGPLKGPCGIRGEGRGPENEVLEAVGFLWRNCLNLFNIIYENVHGLYSFSDFNLLIFLNQIFNFFPFFFTLMIIIILLRNSISWISGPGSNVVNPALSVGVKIKAFV